MNFKMIMYTLGWVLNIEAVCLLLPLICSIVYNENISSVYLISILLCLLFGLLLTIRQPKNKSMYSKEGFVIVAVSWIVISIFGAVPFVLSGHIPNFIDALFETVSGFTTTGASILSTVETLPHSLLFWRSFTHWIGGMGVLVFLVAILPLSGGSNQYLVKAESPGPSVSKLVPKIGSTAKILYSIYVFLTVIEIILLRIAGLDWFESLTLSFGTAGTGGFSIVDTGIGGYTPAVQYIIASFMIIFAIDFTMYYLILLRKFKSVFKSDELKAYFCIIIVSTLLLCFNCINAYNTVEETFRHSIFQVASLMSSTGYATTDYNLWPEFSKTILIMVMFIGACAGSTGGGIKVSRIVMLIKSIAKEIKIAIHPKRVYKTTMNGVLIEHETMRSVNVFMMSYLMIFAFSLLVISLDNFDFITNFTAIVATINNTGPGLSLVGPIGNYGGFSWLSKLVLIFNMIAGRLEIFPVLILFSRPTWRK